MSLQTNRLSPTVIGSSRGVKASVVAAFDARLLQYKTVLQSRINREKIRQSFQLFLDRFLVPTQLYHPSGSALDPAHLCCDLLSTPACQCQALHPQFAQIIAWGDLCRFFGSGILA
jgi:hypothetical protein